MSLKFLKVKAQVTVQDLGRWGFQSNGVPVSGPMDEDSFFQVNALLGNRFGDAAMEIGIGEVDVQVGSGILMALCGNGHELILNTHELPSGKAIYIANESKVKLKPRSGGVWSYLSIGGGFDVDEVMKSSSTYLPAGFGGLNGKPIVGGDLLNGFNKKSSLTESIIDSLVKRGTDNKIASWSIAPGGGVNSNLRVIPGLEWDWLSLEQRENFQSQKFKVSKDSNRMGYRLVGDPLSKELNVEMISSGVTQGTIQLTNDGNLIVLMADGQTIGGYPRVAQVVAVDIPSLAQTRPDGRIQFQLISVEEAEELFLERERARRQIIQGIRMKFL